MKNIGSYSYGIHTHMDTSNFGKKMQYAYGAEHTHMEFILVSAAAFIFDQKLLFTVPPTSSGVCALRPKFDLCPNQIQRNEI